MWTSLAAWLTPAALFVVVNIVIATIAVTSRFRTQTSHQRQLPPHGGPQLDRVPSLLDRVKSFNFSPYKLQQHPNVETVYLQPPVADYPDPDPTPQLARAPSVLERLKSINLLSLCRSDSSTRETESPKEESPETNHDHLVNRSKSDSGSHTPSPKTSLQRRLKKSLSEKLAWVSWTATPQDEEDDAKTIERRRPETSRTESAGPETPGGDDEEVDAKADDFINKFKQQLKLQRLESLLRYRDTMKGK